VAFAQAFIDEMRDPLGELLNARVHVRLNDGQNHLLETDAPGDVSPWSNSSNIIKDTGSYLIAPGGGKAYTWENDTGAGTNEYIGQDVACGGRILIVSTVAQQGNTSFIAIRGIRASDSKEYRAVWQWVSYTPGAMDAQDLNIIAKGETNMGSNWWKLWIVIDAAAEDLIGNTIRCRFYPAEQSSTLGAGCWLTEPSAEFHDDPTVDEPGRFIETDDEAVSGQVGRLVSVASPISGDEKIISLNPITMAREKKFGVVSSQSTMLAVTNEQLAMIRKRLAGCNFCVEAGFPNLDVWEPVAQGLIDHAAASTDLEVAIEGKSATGVAMEYKLTREMGFFTTGYNSPLYSLERSANSRGYQYDPNAVNENAPLPLGVAGNMSDETIIVEFTSATAFKIILEDGDETQTGTITANCTFYGIYGSGLAGIIPTAGWDTVTSNAYATGDRFVCYSSAPRTSAQLSPINMIAHLIEDVAAIQVMDVVEGNFYDSPLYDKAGAWTTAGAATASDLITGVWDKDSELRKMIQDALKVCHGSIFQTHTGQIGVWLLQPSESVELNLIGDASRADCNVLSGEEVDDLEDQANQVEYHYKALYDGADAYYTRVASSSPIPYTASKTITIGWRVAPAVIDASASKYLNRFGDARLGWRMRGNLDIGTLFQGDGVNITEPNLGVSNEMADVTVVTLDPLEQEAEVTAHRDPVVLEDYARVSSLDPTSPWYQHSQVGGTKKVW